MNNLNHLNKVWSVSDFLKHINQILSLEAAIVEGEINELKKHPTGIYFTLKDTKENGILPCYLNPWQANSLGIDLTQGLLVQIQGTPSIYQPKGTFNFYVENVLIKGEGLLKKKYELLKSQLQKEGLFSRKREIPALIQSIGLITSQSGAAIGDFMKNIKKIGLKIYFYNVRVEGIQAPQQILEAIDYFNQKLKKEVNVLVIIRGGGSLEDLQAFNNEAVVRKIFASEIPVICGIGHEKDVPLANLVSDLAVSTPSFAAQIINNHYDALLNEISFLETSLLNAFEKIFSDLPLLQNKIINEFSNLLNIKKVYIQNFQKSILSSLENLFYQLKTNVYHSEKYLKAVNPLNNLRLGYSLVFNQDKKLLKSVEDLKEGDKINTKLYNGSIKSTVTKIEKKYE
jgi:exodeoxyribonuclease VII large subunit